MSKVNYVVGDYYDGENHVPKGDFRLSPSGVERFFSDKTQWYRENLLGEPKKFQGSTSTVLGTICHHAAEVVANCKLQGEVYDSDKLHTEVENYIAKFEGKPEYDTMKISNLWQNMATVLVKEFVLPANILKVEEFIAYEIMPGIWPSGTYDAIVSSVPNDSLTKPVGRLTLRDYKTASSKPSTFSYAYKLQAYTYAYILYQQGIKISDVELCYVVQPTKTLPVRHFNFTAPFDVRAYNFIESILKLIGDSVTCFKDYSDLQYLLMSDYRMKKNPIPRP
jgi:hypothetical protein